ncbi:hypothetical protein [Botrimarina mediterranea]|uniref:RNA polymerase subunit sigma n=1 Tax=Botrimarina mediterranea TaxID=2528022 RepID=A0A518KB46_9BACT|nr:hypothetical protein [Botrimarina mediterranea]QDV75014.1 hypothetical protein Spa11_32230 [Botrimarina mediterranea]QDV79661.1 hypothetical protein K2D_32760 [Planctomycetes bacterium K2D]
MSTIRVGSNEKYASGWEKAFGGGKSTKKQSAKKKTAKKAAPKKAAKKKGKKKK